MHRSPLRPGNIPGIRFCWKMSQPQSQSADRRSLSMNNPSDTIGKSNTDLPAYMPHIRGGVNIKNFVREKT